jgi:hypothetical protein
MLKMGDALGAADVGTAVLGDNVGSPDGLIVSFVVEVAVGLTVSIVVVVIVVEAVADEDDGLLVVDSRFVEVAEDGLIVRFVEVAVGVSVVT